MSLKYLDYLFKPKSIALIGASSRPKSIGQVVMKNLLRGEFTGPILPVTPKYNAVYGILTYPSVMDLPLSPDLAIICTPPGMVPDYLAQLAEKQNKASLIMSTHLETIKDEQGQTLLDMTLDIAHQAGIRILGPNCLGIMVPRSGLNASFGHTSIHKGQMAFISQSDSLGIAVLDWARGKEIGFSNFISLGDCSDIDLADIVDYLATDPYTSSILLYIEQIKNARKFISAARSASRNKPLVVIRSGHFDGLPICTNEQLIDNNLIYNALFRRAGMLRVFDIAELFDVVETLARSKPLQGDRLAVLSNGGGPASMIKDYLQKAGGRLAVFSPDTLKDLQTRLSTNFFGSNPIRIIDHASSELYAQALEIILKDKGVDAVMVIHVPSAFASSSDIAGVIVNTIGQSRKNIYTIWLGEEDSREARRIFALAGIPSYETPDQAVRLFMDMVRYRNNQELLKETPKTLPKEFVPDSKLVKALIKNALLEKRTSFSPGEISELLSGYGIEMADSRTAADSEEAALFARELGFPVALKIYSPQIKNKQAMGGVALDIDSEEDLKKTATLMLKRIKEQNPDIILQGFIVQKMARRPEAFELLAGIHIDPEIGPLIFFGQGGPQASIIQDIAIGLPPLNMTLAKEIIQQTKISKLLTTCSGRSTKFDALCLTLVQLSQLIIDHPELKEVVINPLLADQQGILALDARIEIAPHDTQGKIQLAIRPYPEYLEEEATLANGQKVFLRPIKPEDEVQHLEFIHSVSQEDLRLRFFGYVHDFTHTQLAYLTQIDYEREMAFIATTLENGHEKTLGVVRTYFDPDNITAEFAILVRSDLKVKGLGTLLTDKMLRYCRQRKTKRVVAYTLRENRAMQALGKKFGFRVTRSPDDPEAIELILDLTEDHGK